MVRSLERMKLSPAKFSNKKLPKGAHRMCAMICIFLLTAVPALADPVTSKQVVQTLNSSQGTLDLRLNTLVTQDPATTKSGPQQNGPRAEGSQGTQSKTEPIVAGVAITSE